jgi:hypothetical protein
VQVQVQGPNSECEVVAPTATIHQLPDAALSFQLSVHLSWVLSLLHRRAVGLDSGQECKACSKQFCEQHADGMEQCDNGCEDEVYCPQCSNLQHCPDCGEVGVG